MGPGSSLFKMLLKDAHGAVALETPFVLTFLFISLLFPLADVAIAGFQFIAAYQAMRDMGQYVQYRSPPDVTNWSGWKSSLPTAINGYSITGVRVICGDTSTDCSTTNTASPKYYYHATTVTVSPMVLGPVFCGSGNSSCTFTLNYSERFQ
jgi:Flp pilus assembly protein TadG